MTNMFRIELADKTGFFIYSVKYFKAIDTIGNKRIYNSLYCNLIDVLGGHSKEEISGSGSNRHKGIKKIKLEARNFSNHDISVKEIKSLIQSQTTLSVGLGKIKRTEKIFFPYSAPVILNIITNSINKIPALKSFYLSQVAEKKLENNNIVDIIIPDYLSLIERVLDLSKNYPAAHNKYKGKFVDKIQSTVNELYSLNKVKII